MMQLLQVIGFILFTAGVCYDYSENDNLIKHNFFICCDETGHINAFSSQKSSKSIATSSRDMSMKIFDWKQREAFEKYEVPDG